MSSSFGSSTGSAEEEGERYRLDAMCSRQSGNPEPQAPSSANLDSRFRGSTGAGTSEQSVASSTLRRAMYAPRIALDSPPTPTSPPPPAPLAARPLDPTAEAPRNNTAITATRDHNS